MFKKIMIPYWDLRYGCYFAIFVFFVSLVLNTSFHIMGVNVSEFMDLFLSKYYFLILSSQIKILFSMVVFFSSISYLIIQVLKINNIRLNWIYPILLLICMNSWIHSMIVYPQLYGEFFFIRFPVLQNFLFFFTDHVFPAIPYSLNILFLILFIYFVIRVYRNNNKLTIILTYGVLFFLVIHLSSKFYLLILFMIFYPQIYVRFQRVGIRKIQQVFFFLILVLGIYTYHEEVHFLFKSLKNKTVDNRYSDATLKHPHVFIFSVDSLRPDHIGYYNGENSQTPNMNEISRDSYHFTDHHVTIPRTFPSWTDILTGQLSANHGITTMFPDKNSSQNLGNYNNSTIPFILNKLGYSTSVLSGFAGDIFPRANFGFQESFTPNFNAKILSIQRGIESQILFIPILTGSFLGGGGYVSEVEGLSSLGDDKRLFSRFQKIIQNNSNRSLFMVYFSSVAHFPYSPPYPYYKKYTNKEYYGKYKYHKFVDPSEDKYPNQKEIEQIQGLYKSAIESFDNSFGRMIRYLKEHDLYNNSIIILTADHGESLFEEDLGQGHGEHLRGEAVTKVPMIIKFPKTFELNENSFGNSTYTGTTSSLDIKPTILDILNLSVNSAPGYSMVYQWNHPDLFKNRVVYSESGIWFSDKGNHFFQQNRIPYPNILEIHNVDFEDDYQIRINDSFYQKKISLAKYRAIQNSQFKLIYIPTREGVQFELYDRMSDPWNRNDLSNKPEYREVFFKMEEDFFRFLEKNSKFRRVGDYLLENK
jgi:arylsulfatase A-like enzyme